MRSVRALVWLTLCGTALALNLTDVRKPPPDSKMQPFRERLTALVREHYPQLLIGTISGTPVLIVLFNSDGTIARSELQTYAQDSGTLTANESQFERFGLHGGELQYVGVGRVQLPSGAALVVFGARSSQDLDRALVERYFPQVLTRGLSSDDTLWILFDHAGAVIKTGQETLVAADLKRTLEARFPGIRIADATASPITRSDGKPIEGRDHQPAQLHSLWLAADSPTPNP